MNVPQETIGDSTGPAPVPGRPPGRIVRFFGGIGLFVSSFFLLGLVLLVDVLLTDQPVLPEPSPADTFDLTMQTYAGRIIGGGDHPDVTLRSNPVTFYEHVPDQHEQSINAQGFRGPELDAAKSRPRVVVVGGSAAFGLLIRDESRTFVGLLRERFPQYEFVNAGVTGFLSVQELAQTSVRLLDLEPDLIVAFDGWNDLYDNYWWEVVGDGAARHPLANSNFHAMENRLARLRDIEREPAPAFAAAARSLVRNSTILSWCAHRMRRAPAIPADPPALDGPWFERTLDLYVSNLIKLQRVADGAGCRLLVVLQPELSQVAGAEEWEAIRIENGDHWFRRDFYWRSFPAFYETFRTRAGERLQAADVAALDMSAALARGRPANRDRGLFLDPVHLSVAGHEEVARILEKHVAGFETRGANSR